MSDLFLQVQKAIEVCSSFDRYRLVRYSPLKINCRCPVCGDSEKSSIKARFWVNEKDGTLLVGCFNCGYHSNFISFCKEYHYDIFKEMMIEKYKNTPNTNNSVKQDDTSVIKGNSLKNILKSDSKSKIEIGLTTYCKNIKKLPKDHFALQYMIRRKIPLKYWDYFYFTEKWQEFVNSINKESYKNFKPEPRIVMVIKDFDGKITSFQGRSFEKNSRNKYITIKESENSNKIFGLDKVDTNKTVFITEGIIDSLFLENSIAITGGSLNFNDIPIPKDKRVFVWDNEPYAEHTVKRIENAINHNENIVLFDKVNWNSKDINDLIIEEKISKEEVNDYLKNNIINGLQAKLRFNVWKRV